MSGGGKYDLNGPVVTLSEVQDPWAAQAARMEALGASPEVIEDVRVAFRAGHTEIRQMNDGELAARIASIMAGTTDGWRAADKAAIAEARASTELWAEARDVVAGNVAHVMSWVGNDPGRAYVAHEAELDPEVRPQGPRKTIVAFCKAIHGQGDIEPPVS